MSDFFERYNNLNNLELIKIIENPKDYQPVAVETARKILISRQVSAEEISDAKAELARQNQEKNLQTEKKKELENKVKNFGASVVETIHPIQVTAPTVDRTILIISIVLAAISLKTLFSEFRMLFYILSDSGMSLDFSVLLYLVPILLLPFATVLFWLRKKAGWWILAMYFTFNASSAISSFLMQLSFEPSGYSPLDNVFQPTSIVTIIWGLIFNGGLLYVICKENIRAVYTIDKKKMYTAIGVGVALFGVMMMGVFM